MLAKSPWHQEATAGYWGGNGKALIRYENQTRKERQKSDKSSMHGNRVMELKQSCNNPEFRETLPSFHPCHCTMAALVLSRLARGKHLHVKHLSLGCS
jgi:hypothetical protein